MRDVLLGNQRNAQENNLTAAGLAWLESPVCLCLAVPLPSGKRHRHRHRLEAKRQCVNADVRNSRPAKGSHATSEVWDKKHSQGLSGQERDHERRLCIRSLLCLRSNLLC